MKWIRRILATLGALTMLLTLVTVPKASAEIHRELGKFCAGVKVRRCVWVNVDLDPPRVPIVRAYAAVRDKSPGNVYTVTVRRVLLQSRSVDYPTWSTDFDDAVNKSGSVFVSAHNRKTMGYGGRFYVRAKALVEWTGGPSPDRKWLYGARVYVHD